MRDILILQETLYMCELPTFTSYLINFYVNLQNKTEWLKTNQTL